jgi:hypothetical protein
MDSTYGFFFFWSSHELRFCSYECQNTNCEVWKDQNVKPTIERERETENVDYIGFCYNNGLITSVTYMMPSYFVKT